MDTQSEWRVLALTWEMDFIGIPLVGCYRGQVLLVCVSRSNYNNIEAVDEEGSHLESYNDDDVEMCHSLWPPTLSFKGSLKMVGSSSLPGG